MRHDYITSLILSISGIRIRPDIRIRRLPDIRILVFYGRIYPVSGSGRKSRSGQTLNKMKKEEKKKGKKEGKKEGKREKRRKKGKKEEKK